MTTDTPPRDDAKHTPGPLSSRASSFEPEAFDIVAPRIGAIAIVKHPADAAWIVQCVNAHDELVDLLDYSIDREYNPFEPYNQSDRYKRLVALRLKATGRNQ